MGQPVVAVVGYHLPPGRVRKWDTGAFAVPDSYIEALGRAGGTPAILAPGAGDAPSGSASLLRRFDALLLVGGGDLDPALYGAATHDAQYGVDAKRDDTEIALLRAADRVRMPTLAICRGVQAMNVAFGGSLIQHIPDVDGLSLHGTPGGGGPSTHEVKVSEASRLFAATSQPTLVCSSHHHQGIDRLGQGLAPVAWSGDGLVEGVERPDGWMVGVQWHPEDTAATDPSQQALFTTLIDQIGSRNLE